MRSQTSSNSKLCRSTTNRINYTLFPSLNRTSSKPFQHLKNLTNKLSPSTRNGHRRFQSHIGEIPHHHVQLPQRPPSLLHHPSRSPHSSSTMTSTKMASPPRSAESTNEASDTST